MNWKLSLFLLLLLLGSKNLTAQTLTATYFAEIDTTGLDATTLQSFEKQVVLDVAISGSTGDTLVVELGPSAGNYDLLTRKFPLSETGTFDDGCSLGSNGSGLTIGLGTYTGVSSLYARAYLASSGEGSAVTASLQ